MVNTRGFGIFPTTTGVSPRRNRIAGYAQRSFGSRVAGQRARRPRRTSKDVLNGGWWRVSPFDVWRKGGS